MPIGLNEKDAGPITVPRRSSPRRTQMIQLIWIKELSPLRDAVSRGVLYTLSAFAMWLVYYG